MRVCHLTSVHSRGDTRIFLKECRSLANAGHETALIVADGNGDDAIDGVRIYDVGRSKGRLDRMRNTTARVLAKAISLDASVYHFHDPELIPAGIKLKAIGKRVVFDAHEDLPKQLLGKPYLSRPAKWLLSKSFALYERWACRRFDGIVTATPYIRDKFLEINPDTVDINNFPMLGELSSGEVDWSRKECAVCYVGGIAQIRGMEQLVEAMTKVKSDARLQLGGRFSEAHLEERMHHHLGWRRVDALGFLDRDGVRDLLQRSVGGLVTFLPAPNHIDAQPNKMFEYMSAGVPVIASNFPLWREIIEGHDCGLCVDPLDSTAIARAIDLLVSNPERAEQMGRNGQKAVREHFNWAVEERKLLDFYAQLERNP